MSPRLRCLRLCPLSRLPAASRRLSIVASLRTSHRGRLPALCPVPLGEGCPSCATRTWNRQEGRAGRIQTKWIKQKSRPVPSARDTWQRSTQCQLCNAICISQKVGTDGFSGSPQGPFSDSCPVFHSYECHPGPITRQSSTALFLGAVEMKPTLGSRQGLGKDTSFIPCLAERLQCIVPPVPHQSMKL